MKPRGRVDRQVSGHLLSIYHEPGYHLKDCDLLTYLIFITILRGSHHYQFTDGKKTEVHRCNLTNLKQLIGRTKLANLDFKSRQDGTIASVHPLAMLHHYLSLFQCCKTPVGKNRMTSPILLGVLDNHSLKAS